MINATKAHFARHGIADMVTESGPQYSSAQFAALAREWEFQHTTPSPFIVRVMAKLSLQLRSLRLR